MQNENKNHGYYFDCSCCFIRSRKLSTHISTGPRMSQFVRSLPLLKYSLRPQNVHVNVCLWNIFFLRIPVSLCACFVYLLLVCVVAFYVICFFFSLFSVFVVQSTMDLKRLSVERALRCSKHHSLLRFTPFLPLRTKPFLCF